MSIEAKIVADSINNKGNRLTTFVVTFPRFILAEVNTHRMLSRNSASSRAVPVLKMIGGVLANPAMPVRWGANARGMQDQGELSPFWAWVARRLWIAGSWLMCGLAYLLSKCGAHKQLANRVIEPWCHTTAIISATEWGNFFNLRVHPSAQPEFQALAAAMLRAYIDSEPQLLAPGEWHVPLGGDCSDPLEMRLKRSVAACARISYHNIDAIKTPEDDARLHDHLLENGHCSPFEHQAMAPELPSQRGGNFQGFFQYRKMLTHENRAEFNPEKLLEALRE